VQMSIDGYIAGPNGEMDWMVWDWDDKLKKYVFDLTDHVDTIILGRKIVNSIRGLCNLLSNKRTH
jgi:dihydrofolate reductase